MSTDARRGTEAGYEQRDVTGSAALWFVIGFVGSVALLIVLLTWLATVRWNVWSETPLQNAPPAPQVSEGPRLQEAPEADLAELRRAAETRLGSFGWVDRARGIAHIPIEEAMRLRIERARQGDPE
jgi:hypothetical protein